MCFQLVNSLVSWENFFVFWYMKLVLCLIILGYHRKISKSGEAIKAITAFYLQVKPQGQSSLFICSAITHDVIDIQFVTWFLYGQQRTQLQWNLPLPQYQRFSKEGYLWRSFFACFFGGWLFLNFFKIIISLMIIIWN